MVSSLLVRSETDLHGYVKVGFETSPVARDASLNPEFQRADRPLQGAGSLETALRPLCDGGAVCGGAAVAAHDGRVESEVRGHDSASGMEIAPRAQALGSADRQAVGSPKSRDHVGQCHNSRIHESRSSTLACARALSGGLLGARFVGAVSAARGSASPPVTTWKGSARASCLAGACAGAAARVCPVSSSSAVSAVAHAHASTLHGAHNSWSDTVRVQGPTWRKRVKGGISGPAEDLRPVSEEEAG